MARVFSALSVNASVLATNPVAVEATFTVSMLSGTTFADAASRNAAVAPALATPLKPMLNTSAVLAVAPATEMSVVPARAPDTLRSAPLARFVSVATPLPPDRVTPVREHDARSRSCRN
jgi:hypothetical protein